MVAKGLSQSELARRIGVTQATIYRVVNAQVHGTKYLHLIARELGSTPAYLAGDVDDPTENSQPSSLLTESERRFLAVLRRLSDDERAALMRVAEAMIHPASAVHESAAAFDHGEPRAPVDPGL